jgi:DNA (cytosine-5)-methyltransferase 1
MARRDGLACAHPSQERSGSMRFASVCSGVDAASVAWLPLGWRCEFFSEIAPFPSAVLAHHYPHVPNFGDMNDFRSWPDATFDVLVGGTPCQSFSMAGFRAGIADPRGNLALVYLEILRRYRSRWFVWENVPGVLSSGQGRDFGSFIGGLAELGYGFCWRTLNARYFGVAQQRARVFVVGCLGDWASAAAVLLEPGSLRGNIEARGRSANEYSAATEASARTSSADNDEGLIAFNARQRPVSDDVSGALDTHPRSQAFTDGVIVRRFTPLECERLQGFPDNYTAITYRGKPATDTRRYEAIGNSIAVPLLRWIGERVQDVDELSSAMSLSA